MIHTNLSGSRERSSFGPRNVRPFVFSADDVADVAGDLSRIGIDLGDSRVQRRLFETYGMDALQPSITTANITTPVQFLQNWLPGFVAVITAARKIDELIGISTVGDWEDEEIIQGVIEQLGTSVPYGDLTNVPLASWNVDWERRSIVRFEEGMRAGVLEEARAAKIRVNSSEQKRGSAALALEIIRNSVGFFGFNGGNNRTYGFLNDPALPAAVQFPFNGGGTSRDWSQKTFQEITKDIRLGMTNLRIGSQDVIDPYKTNVTCALPTTEIDYLSVVTDLGTQSVKGWAQETFPKLRFESAPELVNAVGGVSVAYFYAEEVEDTASTDDKRTWINMVPTKFRLIGVQQQIKGVEEDYSNAMAGVMLKRPYAVGRYLYA